MKVLIVEDEVVQRDCLEQYLRPRGCWTDGVATVQAAILRLKVSVPDIVLADYVLINGTAASFLALMRQLPKCENTPIVVVSAIPEGPERDGLMKEIEQYPPAQFVPKPYGMPDLFELMCEMTHRCELVSKTCEPPRDLPERKGG